MCEKAGSAAAPAARCRNRRRSRFIAFSPRQAHSEHRALALLTLHRHIAAHHARKLAGDGKAEPGATEALSGRGIGLGELLKELRLLLRGHADPGVSNRELDPAASVGDP